LLFRRSALPIITEPLYLVFTFFRGPAQDNGLSVDAVNYDAKRWPSSGIFSVFVMILAGFLTVVAFLAGLVVVGGCKVELAVLEFAGCPSLSPAAAPERHAGSAAPRLSRRLYLLSDCNKIYM